MTDEHTQKTSEEAVVCPRCGKSLNERDLKVDDDAMQAYLRATLSGERFTKTFKIADGKILVTFTELPSTVADKLQTILRGIPAERLLDKAVDYKLLLSLLKVEFVDNCDGVIHTKYEAYDDDERLKAINNLDSAFTTFSESFDESTLRLLRQLAITFGLLVKTITDSMLNSDFYEGVGLL